MSDATVEDLLAFTRALESRDPALANAVIDSQMQLARLAAGQMGEAILFANALDRLDDAFAFAEAYYFRRGIEMTEEETAASGFYLPLNERHTRYLFDPVAAPMRKDSRFARLVGEIGLERYWRDAGVQPDYRRA